MLNTHGTKFAALVLITIAALNFSCVQENAPSNTAATSADGLDRTILPIAEPKRQTYKELDARNAQPPKRWQVTAPEGAPNVVVVLIDDMGFGASSAFGDSYVTSCFDKASELSVRHFRLVHPETIDRYSMKRTSIAHFRIFAAHRELASRNPHHPFRSRRWGIDGINHRSFDYSK